MAAISVVGGRVWQKIKLIQAFILVLVTCKNKEDPFKKNELEWSQQISRCKSMWIFQTLKGSLRRSIRLVLLEIQTHPSVYGCLHYLQE